MPEIAIPKEVIPGFDVLAKLPTKVVHQVVKYMVNANVSSNVNDFLSSFDEFISSDLKIEQASELVKTIFSFSELFKDNTPEKLSIKLTDSYKKLHAPTISEKDYGSLNKKLYQILSAYDNLTQTLKAHRLIVENENVYKKSKVISDIRIIFSNDISEKKRNAVLVHKLHISCQSDNGQKEFFITMDLEDLKELQKQIERAIEKDIIIKEDYTNLGFI